MTYPDSDEEFDPQELVKIAKPPPSNFIWPPPIEEAKVPIAAPLYTPVPETQHVTAKPCTYRPLIKPSTQNVQQQQQQQQEQQNKNRSESSMTTDFECLNVDSNMTAITTSTSNASSESEYKMYETQNNQQKHNETVERIDLRKTPPPIELPKDIKIIEFVEPEPGYKAETFTTVFSSRKEKWQTMTETVLENNMLEKKYQKQKEQFEKIKKETTEQIKQQQLAEVSSEIDEQDNQMNDEEVQQIIESASEDEAEPKHVGPYDGTYYQLPPTNIPQPVPKLYQSDLQKALMYTPDKPYSIRNLDPTPEPKFPCLDLFERAVREVENQPTQPETVKKEIPKFEIKTTKDHRDFPHNENEVRPGNSMLSSMMQTASPKQVEFVKSNIIEEIPLPDESEAYFPPPISMEPNEPYPSINSYRTKSPFVAALTTVSDRPFTPFGREIMSQLAFDLPIQKTSQTFSSALKTAPDESFDPSSLEYEYTEETPVEYTAKVYERMTIDAEEEKKSKYFYTSSSSFSQQQQRTFLPTIQPWSMANNQINETTMINSMASSHESTECNVSDSRRCSELEPICVKKDINDLLKEKTKIEEEEFDPEKPSPNAPYPKRNQPSPFEGMQVRVTNKMTSGLHKPDEIPKYQQKWFNLPTQNPIHTPEPEELRENVPVVFKEWSQKNEETPKKEIKVTFAEKPPINYNYTPCNSRRGSVNEKVQWIENVEENQPVKKSESLFPVKSFKEAETKFPRRTVFHEEDEETELTFPTRSSPQLKEDSFPLRGVRKNSVLDLANIQKRQFEKQKSLRQELEGQQQMHKQKQKIREQQALEKMQKNYEKIVHETIREEIEQNETLTPYEQEQEYKRQLQLEKEQREKEKAIKEQQARELEYQRQMEEKKLQEIRFKEKREREAQLQTQREMEYRKQRDEQDEILRIQQEERDREMKRQQEEIERELLKQQERERREAEAREARRLFEIRRKEERDRELAKLEAELKEKREEELKRLEREIREKREERLREEKEAEIRRNQERIAREQAEKEANRLEEEVIQAQKQREKELQAELKLRQKQEADRKQREEMELFNIEEERKRNEELQKKSKAYAASTYQQQLVWPPSSNSSTPAPIQQEKVQLQHRQIPIIKTENETELNASKFHFEPLDEDQRRFMAGIRPPSTCYSPPTDEKPFPSIPYYQQHLVFEEAQPTHCGLFDPRAISPIKNRSRSPAFGPPPNPLRAFVNKTRDPEVDESGIYLCGERLLSPIWYEKGNKQIPPPVQRRLHPSSAAAAGPPGKLDIEALKESIKKHRSELGTKPPPTPPPMPKTNFNKSTATIKTETRNDLPPKGIVASQIRRLSGDISNTFSMLSQRSSFLNSEKTDENRHELSSISSHNNHFNVNSMHHQHYFTGSNAASASFINTNKNHPINSISSINKSQNIFPNVDNVNRTGSVGTPGALSKHGRTFTTSGPTRGQGILTQPATGRIPICGSCACQIR
ncbi:hypothetical protein PVAND_000969 [Polypedilum vanderplanki]|uniref:Uncharacterized protein n=1 Tax=Polypedilum vanderplanki TaxID=319348 RepID=A0A9J6BLU7_POLVA|nr:hypothetical protein PVAND_000969 [Polypedilum vanderplanki]